MMLCILSICLFVSIDCLKLYQISERCFIWVLPEVVRVHVRGVDEAPVGGRVPRGKHLSLTVVLVPFPHAHVMGRGLVRKNALMQMSSTGQEHA